MNRIESMARYKYYDYRQTKMLPVSYEQQFLPRTFEDMLSYVFDQTGSGFVSMSI
jgi:hypothetical protein